MHQYSIALRPWRGEIRRENAPEQLTRYAFLLSFVVKFIQHKAYTPLQTQTHTYRCHITIASFYKYIASLQQCLYFRVYIQQYFKQTTCYCKSSMQCKNEPSYKSSIREIAFALLQICLFTQSSVFMWEGECACMQWMSTCRNRN